MLTAPEHDTREISQIEEEEDRSWWGDAHCNTGGAGLAALFFSEELQDIAAAKRICADCPVLVPCLEGALERREPWGVWGGELFVHGAVVARKRPRGRPRKHPLPDEVAA
jgi:WhiB family redox-sensing transcriptional regulator